MTEYEQPLDAATEPNPGEPTTTEGRDDESRAPGSDHADDDAGDMKQGVDRQVRREERWRERARTRRWRPRACPPPQGSRI